MSIEDSFNKANSMSSTTYDSFRLLTLDQIDDIVEVALCARDTGNKGSVLAFLTTIAIGDIKSDEQADLLIKQIDTIRNYLKKHYNSDIVTNVLNNRKFALLIGVPNG